MKRKKQYFTTRQKKIRQRRKRRAIISACLFLCVAGLIYGSAYFALSKYVKQGDADLIYTNVFIGEVNVGGLSQGEAAAALAAQEAVYDALEIRLLVEGQEVPVTFGELGFTINNVSEKVAEAASYGKEGSVFKRALLLRELKKDAHHIGLSFGVDRDITTNLILERVAPLETNAVNASVYRENGAFVVTDDSRGYRIDTDACVQAILTYFNASWNLKSGTVAMVSVPDEPTVTRQQLESIQDLLGSFYTYAGWGERVQNLVVGAGFLNGRVMMPGEELSVAAATGPYTVENGYVEATAYENGQVVPSIGGGICQVSTTLYNATMYAELEIVQRQPHSMLVNYVKPSRDAAIAGDYKDFVFKNNYSTPIYIEGFITPDENGEDLLYFNIYGQEVRDPARSVEYVSETLNTQEAGVKYVADNSASLGSMKETNPVHTGNDSQLVKIVYMNGEEVSRDIYNKSHYIASDGVISVGTSSDNYEASAIVHDAIYSQNKETIQAAIEEARALLGG